MLQLPDLRYPRIPEPAFIRVRLRRLADRTVKLVDASGCAWLWFSPRNATQDGGEEPETPPRQARPLHLTTS